MIDCQTTRERLDCLTAPQRAADAELTNHLETCTDCQNFLAHITIFDQKISHRLQQVAIPSGLKGQILAQLPSELHPETLPQAPLKSPQHRGRFTRSFTTYTRMIGAGLAVAFLFAVVLLWREPESTTPFDYTTAKAELRQLFFRIDEESWEDFPAFDQAEFQITRLDPAVRKWTLSGPVGIDLGQKKSHDAAAYRFTFKKWSGTLITLPTERFQGTPQVAFPSPSSGMQVFEWQSADSQLTYLCFVDEGSADELASIMFGSIG